MASTLQVMFFMAAIIFLAGIFCGWRLHAKLGKKQSNMGDVPDAEVLEILEPEEIGEGAAGHGLGSHAVAAADGPGLSTPFQVRKRNVRKASKTYPSVLWVAVTEEEYGTVLHYTPSCSNMKSPMELTLCSKCCKHLL